MEMQTMSGRLTLPTDVDMVEETIRLKNLLGADALRDCDGTDMPEALLSQDAKIYATYYTTRKDNAWAEANPAGVPDQRPGDRQKHKPAYPSDEGFPYPAVKGKYAGRPETVVGSHGPYYR